MAGARLMKLKTWSIYFQQIARKACYSPRSGPFSQMQRFTGKFVQGWSDLESYLVTPALLFCQSHSSWLARPSEVWPQPPLGALVFSQVNDPMKWEMCTANMCLLQRNHKRGVFKILCKATQLLQRIHKFKNWWCPSTQQRSYLQCHSTLAHSV